jgi:hypothetical protein
MQRKKLARSKRMQAIGVAGVVTKLDLICVVGEHLDDRADLARHKAKLRHIANQGHGIEELNGGMPAYELRA